jgi:hypothetical protein
MSITKCIAALVCVMVLAGCDSVSEPDSPHVLSLRNGPPFSHNNVYTFAGDLVGTSKVVRGPNGISMSLQTSGINDGDAVTVWYVVFNVPGNCATSPCDVPDIFDPATRTDVLYGTGHVIGNGGPANFASHRSVGDNSGSVMPFFNAWLGLSLPSVGLEDPFGAEVHLVVRTHEEAIPEFLPDMIQTFNGGLIPARTYNLRSTSPRP